MEYVIYTFDSTSDSMLSEMAMEKESIRARLVPLLPEIDAGCGLALRFEKKFYKEVEKVFEIHKLNYKDRYILLYEKKERKPKILDYDLLR
ncbi:MAG: DUF3343 domain-containing protein [Anaerococcus sp.]